MTTAITHEAAIELESLTREQAIDRLAQAQQEMAVLVTALNMSLWSGVDDSLVVEMLHAYAKLVGDDDEHDAAEIKCAADPLMRTECFDDFTDMAVSIQATLLN